MAYSKWTQGDSEAEFNLAMGTILRLDENLRELNLHFKDHNWKQAFETMQVIYSEISPFLKDGEMKEANEIENLLQQKVNESMNSGYLIPACVFIQEKYRSYKNERRGKNNRNRAGRNN